MNKIFSKIIGQWKGLTIGLSLAVLLVGVFALANTYYADTVNVYQTEESEENFGGITFEEEDFTEGFRVDGRQVYDTYGNMYYNINVNCETDNRATTTADNAGTGISGDGFAAMTICYWENPLSDKDVVVEGLKLDIIETFSIASTMSVATTTSDGSLAIYPFNQWRNATSGDTTIIASTTVATTKNSKKTGFIGIETYPGTAFNSYSKAATNQVNATTTSFILDGGAFVVVAWHPYGATSTVSFDTVGGFTGDVILSGKAYVRGE